MTLNRDVLETVRRAGAVVRRRASRARAYTHIWDSPEGKIVFHDIFSKAGLLTDMGAPSSADDRSYAAGQRSIAIHILERLRWSEGELVRLSRQQTAQALDIEGEGL